MPIPNGCSARSVLIDTNVWFSKTFCDWFLAIQENTTEYRFLWTQEILDELSNKLKIKYPHLDIKDIELLSLKIRNFLGSHQQITGYNSDPTPLVKDVGDYHVVGAALHAQVEFLITNDKGFNSSDDVSYEIFTPDDFFMYINGNHPEIIENPYFEYLYNRSKNSLQRQIL